MRKRIGKLDEKPMGTPTSKTQTKSTPPKESNVQQQEDGQIIDQEAAMITPGQNTGYAEEKDVKFYKREPSSDSIQPSKDYGSGSNHDVASNSAHSTILGRTENQTVKHVFLDLIDANAHMEIYCVDFKWSKPGDITFNVLPRRYGNLAK